MEKKVHLIFMIGLTKEGSHWDDTFVKEMSEKLNADKVTLTDLPGSGKRLHEKSPLSIEGIVDSSHQYYKDEFDNDHTKILITVSLGGMVGSCWVTKYPEDFDKFIIINSSINNYSRIFFERLSPRAVMDFLKVGFSFNKAKQERIIIDLCSNNKDHHDHTYDKWMKISRERPMSLFNMARQTFAGSQFSLDKVPTIPTLVIASKHDKLAHYVCSEKIAHHWNCESHFFDKPHIGHAAHIDAPKELSEVIHRWLD
jgi:pimeloyl-ACP methyl ester carboxylesterase